MQNIRTYRVVLRKEPEGSFTVLVPALPGCITYGETVEEAMKMAEEAIKLYVEELEARGEEVPDDSNTLEYSVYLKTA
jgi:predicted RNase H-like HicB family nuclease